MCFEWCILIVLFSLSDVNDCMLKFMLMLWLLMIWIVIFELLGSMIGWFDSVCGVIGMSMMFVSCGWRIGLVDDSVYVVELVGVVMISLFECWLYM